MPLSPDLQPQPISLAFDDDLIMAAEQELIEHAQADGDACFGYFPAMEIKGIEQDLPASRNLALSVAELEVGGIIVGFNFLRLSLKEQKASARFHLDSDAATALTGDLGTIRERQVLAVTIKYE